MSGDDPLRPMTPQRWHVKNHDGPFHACWRCGRAQAICRSKVAYLTRELADMAVAVLNEARGYVAPIVRYRCRWCLRWHVTTAARKPQRWRAERARRKWLIRTHLPAHAGGGGGNLL